MSFKSKTIALTGAASGIALATARLLASRGASLSLADINGTLLAKEAQTIRDEYGVEVLEFVLDVRKPEQVKEWVARTVERFGGLDGAANLAGVVGKNLGIKGVAEQDLEEWDFVLGVNLTGVMLCMKYQLQKIRSGGSIVNAASIAGLQGRPNSGSYAASKHGVIGITRSAAKEVGVHGTRVNCICPGYIETPMNAAATKIAQQNSASETEKRGSEALNVALKRSGKPEEVASLIAFLLGDESAFITGVAYSIDGGWQC